MEGSTIKIGDNDRVVLKRMYIPDVPTGHEVNLLFGELPDYSPVKIGLSMIAFQGMRPVEVPRLHWSDFDLSDSRDRVLSMRHRVYKPTRAALVDGTSYYFKEVQKPIYSEWLSKQIIEFSRRSPPLAQNRVFQFRTRDTMHKFITDSRARARSHELSKDFDFLLDSVTLPIAGPCRHQFRFSLYSLRRFAFTFHYWVTFKQDGVALARTFGHNSQETTMTHYVRPKEFIGLTQDMIDRSVSLDQFIQLSGKSQKRIVEYIPEMPSRFLEPGQQTLSVWS